MGRHAPAIAVKPPSTRTSHPFMNDAVGDKERRDGRELVGGSHPADKIDHRLHDTH
jgi:hypothetical protein